MLASEKQQLTYDHLIKLSWQIIALYIFSKPSDITIDFEHFLKPPDQFKYNIHFTFSFFLVTTNSWGKY